MGTRADFYTKTKNELTYIGSIAWDGYSLRDKKDLNDFSPNDIKNRIEDYLEYEITESKDIESFTNTVIEYLSKRKDGSIFTKHGWPWPWNNSKLTDETYIFDQDTNKILRMVDYEGDYNDSTSEAYFLSLYELYTEDSTVIKVKVPDMREFYQDASRTSRDSILIVGGK